MSELVSVIVPVYNVEKYISKCLNSILNQTYKNIEIIIVNDGSTDFSEKIIKENYINNPLIKYIKQNNSGLGAARNIGIEQSKGNYLLFVDSDDWIKENAIEIMVNAINKHNGDICICNMVYIFEDGKRKKMFQKYMII